MAYSILFFFPYFTFYYLFLCCCCLVTKLCQLFATIWMVAHQAPLSVGSPRQEHWSGLPSPSPSFAHFKNQVFLKKNLPADFWSSLYILDINLWSNMLFANVFFQSHRITLLPTRYHWISPILFRHKLKVTQSRDIWYSLHFGPLSTLPFYAFLHFTF